MIIILIGLLRFIPSAMDTFMAKKAYKRGHLYNILVVLNGEEMAVLENIRHEDIAHYRHISENDRDRNRDKDRDRSKERDSYVNDWTMNTSSELLQKRQEVLFYDVYDLLGESGMGEEAEFSADHTLEGDKVVTKENYVHNAHLQTGMIIRARPAKGWAPNESFNDMNSFSSASSDPDVDSYPAALVKLKKKEKGAGTGAGTGTARGEKGNGGGGGQGWGVLDQLHSRHSVKISASSRIAIDNQTDVEKERERERDMVYAFEAVSSEKSTTHNITTAYTERALSIFAPTSFYRRMSTPKAKTHTLWDRDDAIYPMSRRTSASRSAGVMDGQVVAYSNADFLLLHTQEFTAKIGATNAGALEGVGVGVDVCDGVRQGAASLATLSVSSTSSDSISDGSYCKSSPSDISDTWAGQGVRKHSRELLRKLRKSRWEEKDSDVESVEEEKESSSSDDGKEAVKLHTEEKEG